MDANVDINLDLAPDSHPAQRVWTCTMTMDTIIITISIVTLLMVVGLAFDAAQRVYGTSAAYVYSYTYVNDLHDACTCRRQLN